MEVPVVKSQVQRTCRICLEKKENVVTISKAGVAYIILECTAIQVNIAVCFTDSTALWVVSVFCVAYI